MQNYLYTRNITTFLIFDQINFFEGLSHSLQIFDCYALLNHSKTLVIPNRVLTSVIIDVFYFKYIKLYTFTYNFKMCSRCISIYSNNSSTATALFALAEPSLFGLFDIVANFSLGSTNLFRFELSGYTLVTLSIQNFECVFRVVILLSSLGHARLRFLRNLSEIILLE